MRKLTIRERVLLVVLLILVAISCYVLLFYQPTQLKVKNLQDEIVQKNETILQLQEMVDKQQDMQKELVLLQNEDSGRKAIPYYDNIQNVIFQLNHILSKTNQYAVNFSTKENENGIVERRAGIPFSCSSYEEVKEVLEQINTGHIPCFIDSVNIREGKEGNVEAEISVIYFEYNKEQTETETQ